MDGINDDYILQELRMKYAEDLEEILECPVCLEIPSGEVTMCVNGHHLCYNCKNLLVAIENKCPTCEGSFSNCRNYAVEKLSEKFQDIRNSILDPRHASNRRVVKNKASVHVQTEEIHTSVSSTKISSTENNNIDTKAGPPISSTNNNAASVPCMNSSKTAELVTRRCDEKVL